MTSEALSRNILVVDDNENLCRSLQLILNKTGYEAESAFTGRDAIEKAKEKTYSIALLDLRLPDMSGLDLLVHLQNLHADMDMILITGQASLETALAAMRTKVVAIITKPLDIQELLTTIGQIIEKKQLICEKQNAEDALRRNEEQYRTLIESLHNSVFVIDQNYRYSEVYFSQKQNGFVSSEEIIGKHIDEILPQDVASLFIKAIDALRRDKDTQVIDYKLSRENEHRWFSATLSLHEDGKRIVSVVSDITERKKVEAAYRVSENKYRTLFDTAPVAIAMTDSEGRFLAVNQGMTKLIGYSWDELKEMKASDIFQDAGQREYMFSIVQVEEKLQDIEIKFRKKNGSVISCLVNWDKTEMDGESVNLVTLRDISARKKAEEDLRATAETSMLYLDIMGHDIRNHLMAIMIGTGIIEQREIDPETLSTLELITETVLKSQGLIERVHATQNLLDIPVSNISLSDVLYECADNARKEFEDATFHIGIEVQKAIIRADMYINCLLENLIDNATVHNPKTEKQVWIKLRRMENGFEVTISDNGPGIPEERKISLFDPKKRFGGVGIHQVMTILRKYNGRISVHDRITGKNEQGAEFRIYFPKSDVLEE